MAGSADNDLFQQSAFSEMFFLTMQFWCQNWGTLVIIVLWLRVARVTMRGWMAAVCVLARVTQSNSAILYLHCYYGFRIQRNHSLGSHILTPHEEPRLAVLYRLYTKCKCNVPSSPLSHVTPLELQTKGIRWYAKILKSRRRPLLGHHANKPILIDLCVGVPILCQLTVG